MINAMEIEVINYKSKKRSILSPFRRQVAGPEAELVAEFLQKKPFLIPSNCRATVFCEPRIGNGFPDIVVVIWSKSAAENWVSERAQLENNDIKLLHYLYSYGSQSFESLNMIFREKLSIGLERLEKARLIYWRRALWCPYSIEKFYAVRQIIAIEAKIGAWAIAIEQAFLNSWFATDTYILTPHDAPNQQALLSGKKFGVKFCSTESIIKCKTSKVSSRPRSYASWLLNEWALRSYRIY
jgi:hypothetical protein